jgi:hypothetical protein
MILLRPQIRHSLLHVKVARAMKDAGMIAALTSVVKLLDLDHPEAVNTSQSILRALEVLTRTIPRRAPPPAIQGGREGQTAALDVQAAPVGATPVAQGV